MLPQKSPCDDPESALFQTPLLDLIDPRHALVTLAQKLDWAKMELLVADKFCADLPAGRQAAGRLNAYGVF